MVSTKNDMEALHTGLCKHFKARLTAQGEEKMTAAEVRELRQFLSDNHIDGSNKPGTPLGDISGLPFPKKDD